MIRILTILTLATSLSTPVVAQEASGAWSFIAGAASDNRSRDVSKSGGDPFVYGISEWSRDDVVYAGSGFETIQSNGSDVEVEGFVGIRPQLAGFDLDLKAAYKQQIAADPGSDDGALEFTANLSRSIGPAAARLQLQHSPDGMGSTEAWTWVEARVGWDFTPALSGTAAIGRREQDDAIDYTGWNAGVTYIVNPQLDIDLRYYDTDANTVEEAFGSAVVLGFNVYF